MLTKYDQPLPQIACLRVPTLPPFGLNANVEFRNTLLRMETTRLTCFLLCALKAEGSTFAMRGGFPLLEDDSCQSVIDPNLTCKIFHSLAKIKK